MDSTVDAMEAAYDALVDAYAAVVRSPGSTAALTDLQRRLDAFTDTCDRAEDLVQAAILGLGLDPLSHDALCRAVGAVDEDLQAAAARGRGQEEEEPEEDKGPFPTTPLAAVAAGEK